MHLPKNFSLKNGKYLIVRRLGQGGYGITYLAIKTEEIKGDLGTFPMSVPVAIKEFFVKTYCTREDLTHDVVVHTEEGKALVPQLKKDFIKEANSISGMKHPNIVRIIDIFEEHQTVYYVMQYLEGGSLADKVDGTGPLDSDTAKKYIFQIGNAVSYLHERKICHYDLKPANIMLPSEDKAVLIDFGISRHYDEQGNPTTARPVGHSIGFSSPEQIIGDTQKFSPASDIYSLAGILYFMLTGKIPSESRENDKKANNCPPDIPQQMWNAIVIGMDPDMNKRPKTVNEWLAILDDSTKVRPKGEEKKPISQTTQQDKPETPEPTPKQKPEPKRPPRPVPWKKWLIGLLGVALCIGGYLLFSQIRSCNKPVKHETEVTDMQWEKKNKYGNTFTYTGTVIDSIPNGQGKAVFSDGSSYEGRFNDGLRDDNNATFKDKDGNVFTGTFNHDTIVQGRITAPDGRYYEGRFSNDQPFEGTWYDSDEKAMYQVKKGQLTNID